jgi:hypothetical protein
MIDHKTLSELLKAMNLDHKEVTRITFDFPADGLATASLKVLVHDDEAKALKQIIEHYRFEAI